MRIESSRICANYGIFRKHRRALRTHKRIQRKLHNLGGRKNDIPVINKIVGFRYSIDNVCSYWNCGSKNGKEGEKMTSKKAYLITYRERRFVDKFMCIDTKKQVKLHNLWKVNGLIYGYKDRFNITSLSGDDIIKIEPMEV